MKHLWTQEEEAMLLQLAALGNTNEQIAKKLGRTKSAVAHKRSQLFKLMPEEPDIKAEEPEETGDEGATELERELGYVQNLCDGLMSQLTAVSEAVSGNVAAMMETVNNQGEAIKELHNLVDSDKTEISDVIKDAFDSLYAEARIIHKYLSHSAIWRLFHSFSAFRAKALQDEAQK